MLYAIRNGGFSGAIMPENIVVGKEANDVAAFLAKYAGRSARPSDAAAARGRRQRQRRRDDDAPTNTRRTP